MHKAFFRSQVRGLKDKLAVVLNKTANDDRLVSALRAENASLKKVRLHAPSLLLGNDRATMASDLHGSVIYSVLFVGPAAIIIVEAELAKPVWAPEPPRLDSLQPFAVHSPLTCIISRFSPELVLVLGQAFSVL